MAVDLWNELIVTKSDKFELVNEGEGAEVLPTDSSNLVVVVRSEGGGDCVRVCLRVCACACVCMCVCVCA